MAVTAAARAGFYGIEKLGLWECVLVFSTLGILVWVAGKEFVHQLIPGSRQPLGVGSVLTIGSAALLGVFALVFRNYRTDHFISAGIACLLTGLLLAIPAAFMSGLLLRRGFAVNPVAAGLAGGALAGLCGVTMLELHCANKTNAWAFGLKAAILVALSPLAWIAGPHEGLSSSSLYGIQQFTHLMRIGDRRMVTRYHRRQRADQIMSAAPRMRFATLSFARSFGAEIPAASCLRASSHRSRASLIPTAG